MSGAVRMRNWLFENLRKAPQRSGKYWTPMLVFPMDAIAVMRSFLQGARFFQSSTLRLLIIFCAYILVSRLNLLDSLAMASTLWVLLVVMFLYYILKSISRSLIAIAKRDWLASAGAVIDGMGCFSVLLFATVLNSIFTIALLSTGVVCKKEFEALSPEFKLCAHSYLFRSYYYVFQKDIASDKKQNSEQLLEEQINNWVSKLRENKTDGYSSLNDFGCSNRTLHRINDSIIEIWEVCD